MDAPRLVMIVLGVVILPSACGIAPRPHSGAATPEPHSSTPERPSSQSDPRAWDLFLSGSVVGKVHASLAHACGGGALPAGGAALLLSSDFQLDGREYDVSIWVMAPELTPGTYPAQLRMSEVDSGGGPPLYQGSGTARIVEADTQIAGSVTGSMASTPDASNPPALGPLQLDGQWQCSRLPNAPTRAP